MFYELDELVLLFHPDKVQITNPDRSIFLVGYPCKKFTWEVDTTTGETILIVTLV